MEEADPEWECGLLGFGGGKGGFRSRGWVWFLVFLSGINRKRAGAGRELLEQRELRLARNNP